MAPDGRLPTRSCVSSNLSRRHLASQRHPTLSAGFHTLSSSDFSLDSLSQLVSLRKPRLTSRCTASKQAYPVLQRVLSGSNRPWYNLTRVHSRLLNTVCKVAYRVCCGCVPEELGIKKRRLGEDLRRHGQQHAETAPHVAVARKTEIRKRLSELVPRPQATGMRGEKWEVRRCCW